ncbi:hypothetical protein EXE59_16585 [Nocardioides eburneiflavus]|uniref:Uncharacterized protein n=1 Tax=Nocardioides eburneiflavus TaxID=2518372 RepID=A0A4Z1CL55_9ACTN|nr:hypothetical protein [Nocardioides eburneiflavus]TGN65390.1 hypothetical protein EXE59_16585 [Nocardioides eburneiflavus]
MELPPVVVKADNAAWGERGTHLSDYGVRRGFLERYLDKVVGPAADRQARNGHYVPVRLVPRWDNHLSPLAIQVAAPRDFGGGPDDRNLGWIAHFDIRDWHEAGAGELARHSDHEIHAWALWLPSKGGRLMLALPANIRRLTTAIRQLLDAAPPPPRMSTLVLPRVQLTKDVLAEIRQFENAPAPIAAVSVAASPPTVASPMQLHVRSRKSDLLGSWRDGILLLADERLRPRIATHLANLGVEVRGGGGKAVNLTGEWRVGSLNVYARRPLDHYGRFKLSPSERWRLLCARLNLRDSVLWLEDMGLERIIRGYLTRLGLTVSDVQQAPFPWELSTTALPEDIVPVEVTSAHLPPKNGWHLLPHAQSLLPDMARDELNYDTWSGIDDWVDTSPYRAIYAEHVPEREQLLPGSAFTQRDARCRLCGLPTREFRTPICTDALAYCVACLRRARNGLSVSRRAAAEALRVIGDLEFAGEPLLETQLNALHIDPGSPVDADAVDWLLLCRTAIRRGEHPWTLLLVEAGLADDGVRMARGTILPARDGHVCFSLREKVVDDFLHMHKISHTREPLYPRHPVHNPRTRLRADWRLDDGTLVELWGLPENPAYATKMETKTRLAFVKGIPLVEIVEADLARLPDVFGKWLPEGAPSWQYSPQMIRKTTPRQPAASPSETSQLRAQTSAMSNAEARASRLARAAKALALRKQGYSRLQMAEELQINVDSLAALLRDAAFYADPSADPARLARANDAHRAKAAGWTKAQYRETHDLSAARASQGWQDSDVLSCRLS